MLMKDYSNSGRSKLLLLTLFTLLIGASPTWAKQTLPYSYGFEDNDLATDGWTTANPGNNNSSKFLISTSAKNTGSYGFQFSSYDGGTANQLLVSPELDAPSGASLSFYYKSYNSGSYYTETFRVGYSTSGTDADNFIWGEVISENSGTWKKYENDFPVGTKYIAVNYTSNNKYYLYVDDFSFKAPPTCIKPTDLTVSETTYNSVTLSWTKGSEDQDAWQIAYSTVSDFNPDEATPVDATTNPFTLTGLDPETIYYAYVRGNCSTDDKSDWSNKVTFTTPEKYGKPSALSCSSISATSATLTWTAGGTETAWEIAYSTTNNFNIADATIVSANANPATLSGLTAATTYYAKVRAKIDDEYSGWSSQASFTTGYASPYTQAFSTSSTPTGWGLYSGLMSDVLNGTALSSATSGWSFGTSNGVFDSHARVNLYGTSCKYWLVTPNIELGANDQLTFNLALTAYSGTQQAAQTTGTDDKFAVLVSTDNGASWTQLAIWDNAGSTRVLNNIAKSGEEVALSLADYANQAIKIAFYAESTVSNADNNLHIDNVSIDVIPSCVKSTGLAVNSVAATTATIGWTSDATAWDIQYKKAADTDWTLIEGVTDNPYTLTGLTPETGYQVQVRTNCGGGDVSVWTDEASFTTLASCITPTGLTASSVTTNSATLTWTDETEQSAWEVSYSTTSGDYSTVIPVNEKTYTITGLTTGTTYYASVRAVNSDNDKSAWSTEISFVPGVLTVNDGTATNIYIPVYGNMVDERLNNSQFIIPAESLTSIANSQINKLVFYTSTTNTDWDNATFNVYISETESTTFTNSALSSWNDMTKVYTGVLSVSKNKMEILLDDSYEYEGGNLMIGLNQTVKGYYTNTAWYGITTTNYAAIYNFNTTNTRQQFLPKTSIYYSPISTAPKMAVDKNEIAFGLVEQNSEQTATFKIENKGKADLENITIACTDGAFSIDKTSVEKILRKDDDNYEAAVVTVTFNTETIGEFSGMITVSAEDQENIEIAVSGIVKDPSKIFIDFADGKLPDEWTSVSTGTYTSSSYNWTAETGYARTSASSASYSYALTSPQVVFTEGEKVLFKTSRNTSNISNNSLAVEYSTNGTTWTTIETFSGDEYGLDSWTLREVTIPTADAKYIRFNGYNTKITDIYGGKLPDGAKFAINTNTNSKYFGFVEQNAVAEQTFTITNDGNTTLTVDITDSEDFYVPKTVAFTKPNNWNGDKLYLYAWDSSNNKLLGEWPGIEVTNAVQNSMSEWVYTTTLPKGAYGIIFSDNASHQTSDIKDGVTATFKHNMGIYLDGTTPTFWKNEDVVVAAGENTDFTVKMNTATVGEKSGSVALAFTALNATEFTIPATGYVMDAGLFTETFDGTTTPEGWENTGWTFADGAAYGKWKSSPLYQLITPSLTVAEGEIMAIEAQKTATTTCTLPIYVSKDGADFTLLKTISNDDLEYGVYKTYYIENLEAGSYKIRFDGNDVKISTVNGFHLNQNAPAFEMVTTGDAAFGKKTASDSKTYTVKNAGTGTLTVNIASDNTTDFTVEPTQLNINGGETANFTITFNYTEGSYGNKSANITVTPTYNEQLAYNIAATAKAMDPNAWDEDFEDATTFPTGWTAGTWTIGTNNSYENTTKMALAPSSSTAGTMITPRLSANENDVLTWDAYFKWADEPLIVEYSNDDQQTWTAITTVYGTETGEKGSGSANFHKEMSFTAPAEGLYYLRFTSTYSNGVDNFNGFKLALKEHDAIILEQDIRSSFNQYSTHEVSVTVQEMIGKEETLTAKFFIGDTQYGESVTETIEANGTQTFTVSVTLDEIINGEAYFTVTNDNINLESDKVAVTTKAAIVLDETVEPDLSNVSTTAWQDVVCLKYTAKAGWNTICVPFQLSSTELTAIFGEGYKAYEFKSYNNGELGFRTPTIFAAGYPYIVYSANPVAMDEKGYLIKVVQLSATSAKSDSYGGATFQGTYAPIAAPGMEGKWGVTSEARIAEGTDEASIKGFRAYFELPDGVSGARLSFYDDATGITTIIGADELNDDKVYNLGGQRVQNPKKGLYIINGKKVVIK